MEQNVRFARYIRMQNLPTGYREISQQVLLTPYVIGVIRIPHYLEQRTKQNEVGSRVLVNEPRRKDGLGTWISLPQHKFQCFQQFQYGTRAVEIMGVRIL